MVGCTFAGHRAVLSGGMDKRIHKALASILEKHRDICFYCGGMGEFDILCAREAYKFKRGNPDRNILIYLILPYMMQKIQSGKGTSFELYDEIIIPGDTPDEPEVEIPEEDVPLAELPQTGLLQWPVPLMALAGVVVFFVGYMTDRKAKRDSED